MTEHGVALWCSGCQSLVLDPEAHLEDHLHDRRVNETVIVHLEIVQIEMEPMR